MPSPQSSLPEILLIDIEENTESILRQEGYDISTGSFGVPYRVPKINASELFPGRNRLEPVFIENSLPKNFIESEVVVINLLAPAPIERQSQKIRPLAGESCWWTRCSDSKIDPRPLSMMNNRESFDKIISHGGAFIIFADEREVKHFKFGFKPFNNTALSDLEFIAQKEVAIDNWHFLSILNNESLDTRKYQGENVSMTVKETALSQLLSEYCKGADIRCTFHPKAQITNYWMTLAENKYREPIAGSIYLEKSKGKIFIFPQIKEKSRFLTRFLKDVLPKLSPHLFPDAKRSWVHRPVYELSEVIKLEHQIQHAERQIVLWKEAIKKEQTEKSYLYELIRETGNPLVSAVKKTLEVLGFQSVIDVDEEMEKSGDISPKREDLRIYDDSSILLVEVKGISGFPSDAEALQVTKYVAPRKREWNRTDVQGLSIINHQRNLPALDRDNKLPFREDLLINAQEQGFGLLTTWYLFRLTRSYLKNGWKHKHIKPLFYRSGRIDPVPTHYEFIGIVEHFRLKIGVVSVRIEATKLRWRDRIAFELPVEFEEQDVESLQVNKEPVEVAEVGMLAGISTHLTKEQAKKGIRVFRLVEP
jgi:hypothetical protein